MKIILDAFGGDNAPLCVIEGARAAIDEYAVEIILCGDEEKIRGCAAENNIDISDMTIIHADDIFDMHDEPNTLLKSKANTSLGVAFKVLAKGEADALVSAGSTGAILVGATFIAKRIKGIKRPAIATILPGSERPYLLIDTGANVNCRAEVLEQFGMMGAEYMRCFMGIDDPEVGLLNNGVEETKGGDILVEAYGLLKASSINFVGNIEARDAMRGACDVLVADGFAGNVLLKTMEGSIKEFMKMLKGAFYHNFATKLAALILKPQLKEIIKKTDAAEYGGAPILGVKMPVIKAHGSSNAKAIKNAIRQAKTVVENDVTGRLSAAIEQRKTAE